MPICLLIPFFRCPSLSWLLYCFIFCWSWKFRWHDRIRRDSGRKLGEWFDRSRAYCDRVHGYWIRQEILQERDVEKLDEPPPHHHHYRRWGTISFVSLFLARQLTTLLAVSSIDFAASSTLDIVTIIRRKLA